MISVHVDTKLVHLKVVNISIVSFEHTTPRELSYCMSFQSGEGAIVDKIQWKNRVVCNVHTVVQFKKWNK